MDPRTKRTHHARVSALLLTSLWATVCGNVGCARRGILTTPATAEQIATAFPPSRIMYLANTAPEVARAAVVRALVARNFTAEEAVGTYLTARYSRGRTMMRIRIDVTDADALITYLESDGLDIPIEGTQRQYQRWTSELANQIRDELARPERDAQQAAERLANQAREERERAAQREVQIAQARAHEANAQATARENARTERTRLREEAAAAREEARRARIAEREAEREAARQARLGIAVTAQPSPQVIIVGQAGTSASSATLITTGGAYESALRLNSRRANFGAHAVTGTRLAEPVRIDVTSGGTLDARTLGLPARCSGSVTAEPDAIINYQRPTGRLAFFVDGNGGDTTLIVRDPSGAWWCSDDEGGGNNPQIDLRDPQAGRYEVWIGSYSASDRVHGELAIWDPDQQQARRTAETAPNCRTLMIDAGWSHQIGLCAGAEPYCAAAMIRAGTSHLVAQCQNVDRRCAVAMVEAGWSHLAEQCTAGIDSQCALAMIRNGQGHNVSSCR